MDLSECTCRIEYINTLLCQHLIMKFIIATTLVICGVLQLAVSSPVPGKAVTEETKIKLFQFPGAGGNMCPAGFKRGPCPPGVPPSFTCCCPEGGNLGGGQGQFPFPGPFPG